MIADRIEFREGSATREDIQVHLEECAGDFHPKLSQKVDIAEYSEKIRTLARTFEACSGDRLVGLVAVYMNDRVTRAGFITSVSVAGDFAGRGIASALLDLCLETARREGMRRIRLEVNGGSDGAIRIYCAIGFVELARDGATISMELNLDETRTP